MVRCTFPKFLSIAAGAALLACGAGCDAPNEIQPEIFQPQKSAEEVKNKPNILVIVADDLGFTDLGSFGGEISTPTLDELANSGTRFSQFHAGPMCSVTRAMLLTGVDNHIVGLGAFNQATVARNQKGLAGYEGYLNKSAASMSEIFSSAGYNTYIAGKWHLGTSVENSPPAHKFTRSFVLTDGGAGQFNALPAEPFSRRAGFREDGIAVDLPDDFYSSDFYAEKMIEYIKLDLEENRPFLGYLAYTAPHWPLQAKQETIKKYEHQYLEGYDRIAASRRDRALRLGIIEKDAQPAPYHGDEIVPWSALSDQEKRYEAKRMAVYAAMIDDLDFATSKVINFLKDIGQLDNTIVVFLSDNGAEGHTVDTIVPLVRLFTLFGEECCDNSYENIGNADSFIGLGPMWAQASIGAHRLYKGFPTQGGVIAPAFIYYPRLKGPTIYHAPLSVKDILPTLMELAGIQDHGAEFDGRPVHPIEGRSFVSNLSSHSETNDNEFTMGWEVFGKQAIRVGDWKLVKLPDPYGDDEWQLFDLQSDPAEMEDLSERYPEKLSSMKVSWEKYQQSSNIILPEGPWWLEY
ncbi:arylsulfatase [Microbulbifer pacificus]|uniref:Arylsulfatase n=1 Tax=Microbulbifer pacificus TaxID=407164 RepID=A0AAU0N603_9GAMM|nr:arylsulfatase [Microbulbifer pacificus]WOX07011.1 arylsulfatase [Microbulbifer pacificus]